MPPLLRLCLTSKACESLSLWRHRILFLAVVRDIPHDLGIGLTAFDKKSSGLCRMHKIIGHAPAVGRTAYVFFEMEIISFHRLRSEERADRYSAGFMRSMNSVPFRWSISCWNITAVNPSTVSVVSAKSTVR